MILPLLALALDNQNPVRPIASGPYAPTWDSLKQYQCPEWFRDAKFGIWAHWTAQCQPEQGDWYARLMYMEGTRQYNYQVKNYGHPSKFGFKDIDNAWHAEKWDPERLMKLYKEAGAKYFVAMSCHHDNFDCWNSKYQPWNSVNVGPHKDIVGTWAKIARANGLKFGVSNHSSQAWHWLQVAYDHDMDGPLKDVPYDGYLTKADGKGTWWDGLNPQDLYTGVHLHPPATVQTADELNKWQDQMNGQNWSKAPEDDPAYTTKWFNRLKDLVNQFNPDLLYFDDSMAPLGEAGMNIFADYYNQNLARHGGRMEGVLNTKNVPANLQSTLVDDYERGQAKKIAASPWQTDTCLGDWHYDRSIYEHHGYKTVKQVVHMLADIVSKNGNLLLNVPLRGDGTLDSDEEEFLHGMATWTKTNGEAIYGTRPWSIFGEGPSGTKGGMFSEGGEENYTGADFRFTRKGDTIYAIALGWPGKQATIQSLASGSPLVWGDIKKVELLGSGALKWNRTAEGLVIDLPETAPGDHAFAFKITGLRSLAAPEAPMRAAQTIQAQPDNSFLLSADAATLHGDSIQVESKGGIRDIGFWDDPHDFAFWRLKV